MAVLMVAMVRHGRGNVCARTGREGIREGAVARAQDVLKCVCPKPAFVVCTGQEGVAWCRGKKDKDKIRLLLSFYLSFR
jgi:hypothetical protein